MFRRTLIACLAALTLTAGRAEALSIRDVVELTKAGLSEPVLLALIEVDRTVFTLDTPALKQLKDAGVSDAVIIAMIRSGRDTPPQAEPVAEPPEAPVQPQPTVVVVDHHDAAPPQPQPAFYPVAVPVYVPYAAADGRRAHERTITTTIPMDKGLVKARVPVPPNCVKAEPVYWGWGGKLRPGSYEPPPTVVCR